jgi:hypothetical protein
MDDLERRVRFGPGFRDPKNLAQWAKWWPWSLVMFCAVLLAALVLGLAGSSVSGILVVASAPMGFHALMAWAASHPRRRP